MAESAESKAESSESKPAGANGATAKKEDGKKGKKGPQPAESIPLPDFVAHRVRLWDSIKPAKDAQNAALPHREIAVSLSDGSQKTATANVTTPLDIAKEISTSLADTAVVSKVDGKYWDLMRPLTGDCKLEIFSFDSPEGKHAFWHSSAHILGQAMELQFGAHLCIGPALEEGFYYDAFLENHLVSQDDFAPLEEKVNKIIKDRQPFERMELTRDEALEMFKHNKFKVEIIKDKVPAGETVTCYRSGPLVDLCRGPHVPNTGKIKALALTKNSSAYWNGDAARESLQRVYGVSFPDPKSLKEWKQRMEEAAKRDHRVIGKNQELFIFHPLSPGSAFFLPNGTRIYNGLIDFMRKEYRQRGFQEVITPNMYNFDLWVQSGHAKNYKDNMFCLEIEKQQFGLKPMNCPGHCLVFDSRPRSYRELPLRMADFGVLHRNELSGALSGLTRVRRFQQDDAHIFCAPDQIGAEIENAIKFVDHVYGIFGFTFELNLSTRPENFMGDISLWDDAEKALADALDRFGKPWKINPADGAFYGPKIDITVFDAMKRRFQCATIQLDFQLPINFKLSYNTAAGEEAEKGRMERPVMIHRAVLGSVERMIAILTEHTGGKWPFWISPRQIIIVPVTEKFNDYTEQVKKTLHDAGFYVDSDLSSRKLPKKVREAEIAQYNYILVVGEKEETTHTVNIRTRGGDIVGEKSIQDAIALFSDDLAKYR